MHVYIIIMLSEIIIIIVVQHCEFHPDNQYQDLNVTKSSRFASQDISGQ